MARGGRLLAVCLACCGVGLVGSPVAALGEGSPSAEGTGASSSLGSSLVTSGSPVEGEQLRAQEEAKLANPDVVAEREASRTKFEGLDTEAATKLAREAFPAVVDDPAGGPPKLPAGESIAAYPTDNAAQIDLPEGKHGIIESLAPIAVETGPGQRVPVDLGLRDAGSTFEPTTPVVGVSIPKQLGSGISLSGVGVSFTPVDSQGAALGGSEGSVDGASVLYANTQTDADTVVKPVTLGFEADTLLRSVDSPQQLFFRVGLPVGASLVQAKDGSGVVEVVKEGATLATIAAPVAQDAAGVAVPVSMSVSGDVLELAVDHRAGEYQYPIEVDPYVKSDEQVTGAGKPTHWKFCVNYSTTCAHEEGPFKSTGWGGEGLVDQARSKYAANETAAFVYQTQGESRIFELGEGTSGENAGSNIESVIQIVGEKEKEGKQEEEIEGSYTLSVNTNYGEKGVGGPYVCAKVCSNSSGSAHNIARFQQTATGSGEHFSDTLWTADVYIAQEHGPEQPTFNYSSEKIDSGRQNVLYGSGSWLSPTQGAFEVHDKDPGVGISYFHADIAGSWGLTHEYFEEGKCSGVQCFPEVNEPITYNKSMADGEDTVETVTQDLAQNGGYSLVGQATIKVDGTPPHGIVLNGLPSSGVIDEAQYHLQAQATDGSGKTSSTGVKSIELGEVAPNGQVYAVGVGKSGSCSPGPCTAVGEWTINGETLGAGKHTLAVVATDNAGNIEKKSFAITVRHAGSLGAGPGSVDPITGSFHLSAGDVSIGSGQGSLGVSRGYNSRQLKAGESGPLGPQWSLNISGSHALEQEPSGSVVLVAPDGGLTTFESNGKGGFVSAKGNENLVLSDEKEGESIKAYLLKDPALGTTVKYTQPGGVGPWVIASSEGALSKGSGEKETFEWERLEGLTRPKMALAPVPAGVTCSKTVKEPKELSVGCRALTFVYAAATTATGEAPSEWKAYKGRLEKVVFTAYNPSTKAMEEKPVAEYAYDKQGRLRAEWDPRISTALKTTYGYDAEGHVVSVNPPGLQPWLLHYGTTAGDLSAGRLLSVTRPAASTATELKEADGKPAPVNTVLPTLSSTSPAIGTTLSISSNGSWSNGPLAYGDSWEDCYTQESKETCTPIPGAVNSTYTPQARDAGYTLKAQVTAVNSDGATVATTTASKAVAVAAPVFLRSFGSVGEGEKQFKGPAGEAVDAGGNVWVIDHGNNRVEEWSATGGYIKAYGTKGSGNLQFKEPQGIAINQGTGNVYVADTGNNRIEELNSKGEYVTAFGKKGSGSGELSLPSGVAVAPNGDIWVGDTGNDRVAEFSETGEALGSFGKEGTGNGQFEGPDGIAFSGGNAYVADVNNNRVQEFSLSGEYVRQFGAKGAGEGQFSTPYGIATEPVSGDLWVSDYGNNRIEEFSSAGVFLMAFGKKGAGNGEFTNPEQVAVNATGDVYVSDTANNRVQELEPKYSKNNPAPEPPTLGKSAVSTIDYNVPLWGEGAPDTTAKTEAEKKTELEKWGQTDDPTEATAVFPPDEPMGWPAKDYKRATISYYDELGRTVNRASPSGGISTSEYNEDNEVIRSLSADNRATALKESKSKEASELLDTKSSYNAEGTELLNTWGPQHAVKLSSGSEVKARNHVKYYYDEDAPGGETFDLVTKTTDGAEYEGKEADVRTSTSSYSGREGLGWLLRKPTSITTDPSGLKLVSSIFYNELTGNVTETRSPGAGATGEPGYAFKFQFGKKGTGSSELKEPQGIAVNTSGDEYVADTGNNAVKEFDAKGKIIEELHGGFEEGLFSPRGVATDSKGDVWVADTENERVVEFGPEGNIKAQDNNLYEPQGVAVDSEGNAWVVNTGENQFGELKCEGSLCNFKTVHGSKGSGETQFNSPQGIAIGAEGNIYIADTGNNRIDEYSKALVHIRNFGTEGSGNGQLKAPHGIATDSAGDVWVADAGNNRIEEFGSTGAFIQVFGKEGSTEGRLKSPMGIAIDSEGNAWVADTVNSNVQEWASAGGSDTANAHETQTIYYTAGANTTYPGCGKHPEWANLPCRAQPAAQPAKGLPLPVVTDTYNIWDEPETITEEFGTKPRTKKMAYDSAGRAEKKSETATGSSDTSVPTVTNEYSSETGAMIKQSTTLGETTKSIKSVYNTLGQLTEYTDADGNTTQYVYSGPANDGQIEEINYGGKKGSQMYSYDPTTKALTKLLDVGPEGGTGAGTFTAGYDVEGKLTSETYPNGMIAKYTFNPTSEATGIEYEKTTHCTEKCTWFSETVVPSIHGEALARTSSLAKEGYTYDSAGRLTQVNETLVGKGCKTRLYAYNEDSDRTSETARESATETCATTGGTTEAHTYDEADRLIDTGVQDETFGNQTKIPAADAGEHEITASFYVDNQVAIQKQNGESTTHYTYDPAGRTEEAVSEGTTSSTVVNHYPGSGGAISWTEEEAGKSWTRNIPGIDGALSATQKNTEAAVLQLHDLEGNIVATAAVSETETKLLTTYNATEFGVQVNGTPPTKYSWLGAGGVTTEQSSGAANPGGSSYVPQLGAPLQTEPVVPPGAFPNGAYSGAPYTTTLEPWVNQSIGNWGAGGTGREAARQAEAKKQQEEAEERARADQPPPGVIPTPGEGGADEEPYTVDPSWLLTATEAKILTYALRYGTTLVGIAWPEVGVFIEALEVLGGNVINEASEKLERCYQPLYEAKQTGDARCKAFVNLYDGFIPESWGVELCWKKEYKRKNSVHITYPYCDPT